MNNQTKQGKQSALLPGWQLRMAVDLLAVAAFLVVTLSNLVTHGYWESLGVGCVCLAISGFVRGYRPIPGRGLVPWAQVGILLSSVPLIAGVMTRMHAKLPAPGDVLLSGYFYIAIMFYALTILASSVLGTLAFRRRYPDQAFVVEPEDSL